MMGRGTRNRTQQRQ